jgi:hypothetical protein
VFAVRVSPGGPTAAPDAPPASDNAPATPNTVTAFVRLLRFEICFARDMVETSQYKLGWGGPSQTDCSKTAAIIDTRQLLPGAVRHDERRTDIFDSPKEALSSGAATG